MKIPTVKSPDLKTPRQAGEWTMRQFRSGMTRVNIEDVSTMLNSSLEREEAISECVAEILQIAKPDQWALADEGSTVFLGMHRFPQYVN